MAAEQLYGLVLAGGKSRRMGTDKALLNNAGETQLARAVRLLESTTERVFVSTSDALKDEPERSRFPLLVDAYSDLGPVAGILTALDTHPDVDWLIVACDLPNLSLELLQTLLNTRQSADAPFIAFESVHNGLPEPLCAIYTRDARDIVRALADDGVRCPRKMMILSDCMLLKQPDENALDNVNTPADLESSVLEASS